MKNGLMRLVMKQLIHIRKVSLDAATVCQLRCPSCPTASGLIAKKLGGGYLKIAAFKQFIQENPSISFIELSNWGEIFLNPDLEKILELAHNNNIILSADNGVNLNHASDVILEALVKYQFRSLRCSIDGASQAVYEIYRAKGDFEKVINNIKKINAFKQKYNSSYPVLKWQYIAFGHNEHEIAKARAMATELNMDFYVKLSWDNLYGSTFSPISNPDLIRRETSYGVASRAEYQEKYGKNFVAATCHQLWLSPQINYDGKLLGCCINHWGDFGNVFIDGLDNCLNSPLLNKTKAMLLGKAEPFAESPCINCAIFLDMQNNHSWVKSEDVQGYYLPSRHVNRITSKLRSVFNRFL